MATQLTDAQRLALQPPVTGFVPAALAKGQAGEAAGDQLVMRREPLIALIERYFAAVDRKDIHAVLACFLPEATVEIATYGTVFRGRDTEARDMYERLFERYATVWHGGFDWVIEPPTRVACRFSVRNVGHDGRETSKSNCNFFKLRGGLFSELQIFMSGDNSLA